MSLCVASWPEAYVHTLQEIMLYHNDDMIECHCLTWQTNMQVCIGSSLCDYHTLMRQVENSADIVDDSFNTILSITTHQLLNFPILQAMFGINCDLLLLISPKCRICASVNRVSIGSDNDLSLIRSFGLLSTTGNKRKWNFNQNTILFIHKKHIGKYRLWNGGHFVQEIYGLIMLIWVVNVKRIRLTDKEDMSQGWKSHDNFEIIFQ